MFTVDDYLTLISHKINDGSKFWWDCYGENAYFYNYINQNNDEIEIIFDTVTKMVHEASIFTGKEYKYFNPGYEELYIQESQVRNIEVDFETVSLDAFLKLAGELV
jgi:hypothetical protein